FANDIRISSNEATPPRVGNQGLTTIFRRGAVSIHCRMVSRMPNFLCRKLTRQDSYRHNMRKPLIRLVAYDGGSERIFERNGRSAITYSRNGQESFAAGWHAVTFREGTFHGHRAI